jgi:hypothetical protein
MKGISHHFLFPITGTQQRSDSHAVNQKVSKKVDGMIKKSAFVRCQIISFLCFRH